jgi:hypothetical protein
MNNSIKNKIGTTLEQVVKLIFEQSPEAQKNNTICCIKVLDKISKDKKIPQTLEAFNIAMLKGELPTHHAIAATISRVRRKHPQFELTREMKWLKKEIQNEYINAYYN